MREVPAETGGWADLAADTRGRTPPELWCLPCTPVPSHGTGGLPQLQRCPCPVFQADIPPELWETCAVSAAAALPEDLIYLMRFKPLPCPAPCFPARGGCCEGSAAGLLSWGAY